MTLELLGFLSLLRQVQESIFLNSDVVHTLQEAATSSHKETGPKRPKQCWGHFDGVWRREDRRGEVRTALVIVPVPSPHPRPGLRMEEAVLPSGGDQVLVTHPQEMRSLGGEAPQPGPLSTPTCCCCPDWPLASALLSPP